jgi:hypothetical protein
VVGDTRPRRPSGTLVALPRFFPAAFLAAACASIDPSATADACGDPRLPAHRECKAEPVHYLALGGLGNAVLVRADVGAVRGGDDLSPLPHYFLSTPDGQLVSLGEFAQGNDVFTALVFERQLGIQMRGTAQLDYSIFRDRIVALRSPQRYCVVSRMKAPFVGEMEACDGDSLPSGRIGYSPEMMSAAVAMEKACSTVLAQRARKCEYGDVDVLMTILDRDPNGSLYYKFTLRVNGPAAAYVVYRVDAAGGQVSLLQQSREPPSEHMVWRQRPR